MENQIPRLVRACSSYPHLLFKVGSKNSFFPILISKNRRTHFMVVQKHFDLFPFFPIPFLRTPQILP